MTAPKSAHPAKFSDDQMDQSSSPQVDSFAFLGGGGEMGRRIREFDWSGTPLGPVEAWPQALKVAVRIMLTSRQPIWIGWGDGLIYLYNDPYKSIIGGKHPQALGQPASVVWREIWGDIAAMLSTAMSGQEGTYVEEQLLIMERHGYPEETYYTFSYSPIPDDDGRPGGIICANTDDTRRVIGERQLAMLRELAAGTADARSVDEACERSARALETNRLDLPFALIYIADPQGPQGDILRLAGASGTQPGHRTPPPAWSLTEVLLSQGTRLIEDLANTFPGELPTGAWSRPPDRAAAIPIHATGETGVAGVLVVGLSPFRQFDDSYSGFLGLVAGQIAGGIANAQAYEQERRRAEALTELDRAKTAFFSNVSHEFRTPLTLMLGPVEDLLARRSTELSPAAGGQLEVVNRNGLRLLRLVNTLLDFSRIEAGRVRARFQPTDLAGFTADLASVFRAAIERAGLRLVVECAPLEDAVYVDREMWEKVVLNLLSNAFKFTFEGEIHVVLGQVDGAVRLQVRDTGTGIPEEEMPRLFERFHRVESAHGRTHEGSGIGLALVQELVKLHGGSVHAESVLGEGTTFTVTMPLGSAHLPADQLARDGLETSTAMGAAPYVEEALRWLPEDAHATNLASELSDYVDRTHPLDRQSQNGTASDSRPRVVVADDNADMRQYIARVLSQEYRVTVVADGRSALDTVLKNPPDLVLTDVMMPGLDGFALLRELRTNPRTQALPVILLSARAGEESRVEGMEAGADDYLIKPFSARELLARVTAHVRIAQLRREGEEALRRRHLQFETLLNEAPIGVYLVDGDLRIRQVNPTALPVFGGVPDLIGRDFDQVVHQIWVQPYADEIVQRFRRTLETGEPYSISESPAQRRDRSVTEYYAWQIHRIQLPEGGYGVVCYFRDILAQIQARAALLESEERLRQAAKMEAIGRLAGGIAHDFNNQLLGVSGFARFVAQDPGLSHAARRDLEEMQKAAERMAGLTRQLLAFSRQQFLQPETLDLNAAVTDGQSLLERLIGSNIEISLQLAPEPLWTRADPAQLLQVLMNLTLNARDAMSDGGRLAIRTRRREIDAIAAARIGELEPGSYVELAVIDSGSGIAPDHLPHVFEPFFTTKSVGQGTGLGLATVHGIVAQSHGHISVDSKPGRTAFTVLLPAATEPATASAAPPGVETRPEFRPGRVLVVDDEAVVNAIIARTLRAEGYEVLQARNGRQALEHLDREQGRIDVVLSDVVMPILGGQEFGERLSQEHPEVVVVWMSGYPRDSAFAGRGVADGAPFLQKPVDPHVLTGTIREVLALNRAAHQRS